MSRKPELLPAADTKMVCVQNQGTPFIIILSLRLRVHLERLARLGGSTLYLILHSEELHLQYDNRICIFLRHGSQEHEEIRFKRDCSAHETPMCSVLTRLPSVTLI